MLSPYVNKNYNPPFKITTSPTRNISLCKTNRHYLYPNYRTLHHNTGAATPLQDHLTCQQPPLRTFEAAAPFPRPLVAKFPQFQDLFGRCPRSYRRWPQEIPHTGKPRNSPSTPKSGWGVEIILYQSPNFLEALDINLGEEDQGKKGWHQIRMMFEGDDCQALQTLIDNNTISTEVQHTPSLALNAIQSMIKQDVHFWHYCNEILSDCPPAARLRYPFPQYPLNTLINKCKFTSEETKETIKVMLLQHTVKYHEVTDWICLQNLSTLSYHSLLAHCKQLESWCEQFQQAQAQGRTHLTSLTLASATSSLFNANTQLTSSWNPKYSFPHVSYPTIRCKWYICHGTGHFITLCRRPHPPRHPVTATASHSKILEAGLAGPVTIGTQAGFPAKPGSLTKALVTVPNEASNPAASPPLIAAKEAKEDPHTAANRSSTPYRSIHLVNHFKTSTPSSRWKIIFIQIEHWMATEHSIQHYT